MKQKSSKKRSAGDLVEEEEDLGSVETSLSGTKSPGSTSSSKTPKTPKSKLKKSERGFYVHDMLATFRTDPIPIFFKERHVHKETYNKYVGKLIFKNLG